jgi:myo-inositol 2-dehydrogenase / D-chiro-inositol 1-dehydrogenase
VTPSGAGRGELHVGVIGFGRLVREYYLPALQDLRGIRLAAVADPLEESRRSAESHLPADRIFADHRTMLDRVALDAVLVASSPSTHLGIWTEAIGRGLPAFVEKPLALSSQLSSLPLEQVEPPIMIDFNRRFWPTYNRARDLVRLGALGAPVHLEFGLHIDVRPWSSVTKHRLDASEGGVLHDLGGHAVDLATQIVGGEPDSIAARSAADRIELQLDFAAGSSARCDVGYSDRTREWLHVRGPQGSVRLAEPNMVLHAGTGGFLRNRVMAPLVDAAALGYRGLLRSQSIGRATIRAALASFAASVRTGTAFTPGFADGLRNALWVEAAARSLASDGGPRQRQAPSRLQRWRN